MTGNPETTLLHSRSLRHRSCDAGVTYSNRSGDNDLPSPCRCPEYSTSRHLDVAQEAGGYQADYFLVVDQRGI